MKKNKNSLWVNVGIIISVLIIASFLIFTPSPEVKTDKETIQCIGEKSILYGQLGCTYCKIQEDLFGENLYLINKIDCFYETQKCGKISGTPTWEINGKYYTGVKTIEELKELTKC